MGQIIQQPLMSIGSLVGMGVGTLLAQKDFQQNLENLTKSEVKKLGMKLGAKIGAATLVGMLPAILLDIYVTKEQKKASRIADMLAIKEMDDYRHYADYNSSTPTSVTSSVLDSKKEDKKLNLENFIKNVKHQPF